MQFVDICKIYKTIQEKHICIFGAGEAGGAMFSYLKMHGCRHLFVADNNVNKHGAIDSEYEIGSFDKSVEMNTDIYLVGFINNDIKKIESVLDFLQDNKISKERIMCINFLSSWVKDFSVEYTGNELKKLKLNTRDKKKFARIVLVGLLYNENTKKRISGGTSGAVNMQRILLGNQYKGIPIECLMFPKDWKVEFTESFNQYQHVLFATRFLAASVQNSDAVYISNDIYSAYALSQCEQRYILLYHGQGDFVSDMNAFGARPTEREKEFITYIEKEAIKHSYKTFFPSKGARIHFLNTIEGAIDFDENSPLYNSIYDFPVKKYKKHHGEDDLIFLSIGQMTPLKGMDQIPDFLNRIRKCAKKKIRWIVVADGEIKNNVISRMEALNAMLSEQEQMKYEVIDHVVEHQKIYQMMAECDIYLMLHRISIFDFSTLEAMYMEKPIILSDVAGNDEFNLDNNILLISKDISDEKINEFISQREVYGMKNRRVYDVFFSKNMFKERYYKVFQELLGEKKIDYEK